MPMAPPARVIVISALRTVAGASSVCWVPCPRASKPTASIDASTSGTPRICSMSSSSLSLFVKSTGSNPTDFACARRSGFMSPISTTAAPRICADAAAARPTGPAPAMYTVEPTPTSALTAPWKPVGRISLSIVRSRILAIACALSGNLSRLKSAYGTIT